MSAQSTETYGGEDADARSGTDQTTSAIAKRVRDGSIAMLVGGALLAGALATLRKNRGRATVLTLASVAVFGVGVRQRRARWREGSIETEADVRRDEEGEKEVSEEAHVEREGDLGAHRNADESASVYQSEGEPNPRGVTDRSDVEADDEGDIDFVEGKDPGARRETHLEDAEAHDPRLHPESDDEPTEIDLSEAAMADEASEAAGPQPEQAYPAREGTDPEPTSAKAPEREGEEAVGSTGSNDERRASDDTASDRDGTAETADEADRSDREASDDSTDDESDDSDATR